MHCSKKRPAGSAVAAILTMAAAMILPLPRAARAAPAKAPAKTGAAAPASGVTLVWDDKQGLHGLRVNGANLLESGALRVEGVTLQSWDGTTRPADLSRVTQTVNAARREVTQTFPFGLTIRCRYEVPTPHPDRLDLTVTVENTGEAVVRAVTLDLATLRFPRTPQGWDPNVPYWAHNVGSPTVIGADFGVGTLALCNEDVGRPLLVGFPFPSDRPAARTYPLRVSSANQNWLAPFLDPYLDRPIFPGGRDVYRLSLRFGAAKTAPEELAADVYEHFARAYPARPRWPDRRPIGQLVLSSVADQHKSPTNPRGWLNDPTIDVTSEAGRARFRGRLLAYADQSVRILRDMNAQGAIVWDAEGQEFPHATSYLGDPRALPPEMENGALLDAFFARLRAAGLRTGICIRPQRPVRPVYGAPAEAFQIAVADPAANLAEKITYARKRWNCTLFYIDSNGDPNVPDDANVFRRLAKAFPDVLLIPEHQNTAYFASTAPYDELRGGIAGTSGAVRRVYPDAFSVIAVQDGPIQARHSDLVASVAHGDVLLFRAWFDDALFNAPVRRIYEEAAARRKTTNTPPAARP